MIAKSKQIIKQGFKFIECVNNIRIGYIKENTANFCGRNAQIIFNAIKPKPVEAYAFASQGKYYPKRKQGTCWCYNPKSKED